ncbi:hypothetical protein ACS0TY_008137 [Phlomoides rotata]
MFNHTMVEPRKKRSFTCTCLPTAIFVSAVFFLGTLSFIIDYKERFLPCNLHSIKVNLDPIKAVKSNSCEYECRPKGTETLPRGIVSTTTDLEMRPLSGPPKNKKPKSPTNLLAIAAGIKQKQNVNEIVKKFPLSEFAIMLFHYDGNVNGWKDLEWSNNVIHVSAINQTKWWFAKRFLHPDVAQYDYIFLWDEDLGVENFHAGRYVSIIKEEGLQISQPAIDPDQSAVHYILTARQLNSTVHRRAIQKYGKGHRCFEYSMEPPCTGFVEMMAPVFSRASWRCAWHMIQNDLVHAWGIDLQLGNCAMGDRTKNIGIVDSEYLIHWGIPTLGGSRTNKTDYKLIEKPSTPTRKARDTGKMAPKSEQPVDRYVVLQEALTELERFKNRWKKAVREDRCWVDPYNHPAIKTTSSS